MVLEALREVHATIENEMSNLLRPVGDFLDEYPELYKVCTVALHFFRAAPMAALMILSPFGAPLTGLFMMGTSLLYMAAVEFRLCPWKFTLSSNIGAFAICAARASVIELTANIAFTNVARAAMAAGGLLSLAVYTGWVCYLAHRDVDAYLERKAQVLPSRSSCCGGRN